ncbi:GlxA family transcriptional regulator [Rhizobium leguminosarum]|uniref:GlxA family transcriptional regulator n=1 Tax=Rhizobium leguminosarum TaxID=384 RepID=UPI001C911079|nr:GlxA family transcriptional regulator [Rhizobium leguminosarum]MBY2988449.1 GlxA family transcriptional regulator [Rhizobium leguminosarum]MBY2995982.1 GlxA family transcriptional regulator [Rhizobium leguminosarum]MBY3057159.1 GlxA family transcriptional regulator [Rhizobium leguminosarum]
MSSVDSRNVQKIGFILIPGFALMSYASATEPLRAANLLAGREIYRLQIFSPDGAPALSSSGTSVPAEPLPVRGSGLGTAFVCAGGLPRDWRYPSVLACLRQLSREGVRIGGISGGPYLMAAAGLLGGRDFTIHWEHAAALLEAFPDLTPRQARFVIDGNRITCGGGIAPLDMMHVLIAERMGPDFARRVSDWYLHTEVNEPAAPQRASLAQRYGVHHSGLLNVLERMEETIEMPLERAAMARIAGVTTRHLDRLFSAHLGTTFLDQYRRIRLQHAHRLLKQSPLSVSEIAVATGFSSLSHFSRMFRAVYGIAPRAARRE